MRQQTLSPGHLVLHAPALALRRASQTLAAFLSLLLLLTLHPSVFGSTYMLLAAVLCGVRAPMMAQKPEQKWALICARQEAAAGSARTPQKFIGELADMDAAHPDAELLESLEIELRQSPRAWVETFLAKQGIERLCAVMVGLVHAAKYVSLRGQPQTRAMLTSCWCWCWCCQLKSR